MEASAATGDGIQDAFQQLTKILMSGGPSNEDEENGTSTLLHVSLTKLILDIKLYDQQQEEDGDEAGKKKQCKCWVKKRGLRIKNGGDNCDVILY